MTEYTKKQNSEAMQEATTLKRKISELTDPYLEGEMTEEKRAMAVVTVVNALCMAMAETCFQSNDPEGSLSTAKRLQGIYLESIHDFAADFLEKKKKAAN